MAEPLTEEALAAVLLRGLRPTRVTLVEHDPAWAQRFETRAAELRAALGARLLLLEHIGSTSVPGLVAKPVVDITIAVDDPDDEPAYVADLEALGYDLRAREPGHRCLRIGEPDEPVNLHVYGPGAPDIDRTLAFRDRLRADRGDRELYARTKQELATREWPDMNFYAEAKGPVIEAIIERAVAGRNR
jgi:GrpB-like predicted nucleotidyltransferase (UPF0157 family)